MAAPVVDSVTPSALNLTPGQFADVVFVAHDPDSASGVGTVDIADTQGNVTQAVVTIVVDDPLTFTDAGVDLPNVTSQVIEVTSTSVTVRYTAAA